MGGELVPQTVDSFQSVQQQIDSNSQSTKWSCLNFSHPGIEMANEDEGVPVTKKTKLEEGKGFSAYIL